MKPDKNQPAKVRPEDQQLVDDIMAVMELEIGPEDIKPVTESEFDQMVGEILGKKPDAKSGESKPDSSQD